MSCLLRCLATFASHDNVTYESLSFGTFVKVNQWLVCNDVWVAVLITFVCQE
jgi:hypothetical protein